MALPGADGAVLRDVLVGEQARVVIEIGLGYGSSALAIAIIPVLGAGNRDPERYADPDRLDVTRADVQPLTFGGGIHFCLGAALARAEAQIAFAALLGRFRDLRLDGEPFRRPSFTLRGLASLPVSTR